MGSKTIWHHDISLMQLECEPSLHLRYGYDLLDCILLSSNEEQKKPTYPVCPTSFLKGGHILIKRNPSHHYFRGLFINASFRNMIMNYQICAKMKIQSSRWDNFLENCSGGIIFEAAIILFDYYAAMTSISENAPWPAYYQSRVLKN